VCGCESGRDWSRFWANIALGVFCPNEPPASRLAADALGRRRTRCSYQLTRAPAASPQKR